MTRGSPSPFRSKRSPDPTPGGLGDRSFGGQGLHRLRGAGHPFLDLGPSAGSADEPSVAKAQWSASSYSPGGASRLGRRPAPGDRDVVVRPLPSHEPKWTPSSRERRWTPRDIRSSCWTRRASSRQRTSAGDDPRAGCRSTFAGPGRRRLAHHAHAGTEHPRVGRVRGRAGDLCRGGLGKAKTSVTRSSSSTSRCRGWTDSSSWRTREPTPILREIPAILLTSRGSDEDRQRGRDAGARGYIVKGEFDQAISSKPSGTSSGRRRDEDPRPGRRGLPTVRKRLIEVLRGDPGSEVVGEGKTEERPSSSARS